MHLGETAGEQESSERGDSVISRGLFPSEAELALERFFFLSLRIGTIAEPFLGPLSRGELWGDGTAPFNFLRRATISPNGADSSSERGDIRLERERVVFDDAGVLRSDITLRDRVMAESEEASLKKSVLVLWSLERAEVPNTVSTLSPSSNLRSVSNIFKKRTRKRKMTRS
jgi:hypothetical protein